MSRSVRIHEFGGPDVLKIEEVVVPEPGAGEVRLRIKAIGLNRTEATFRNGQSPVKPILPTHMGFEASGKVERIGPDVEGFKPGDRVSVIPAFGVADYGLYGELSLAPARSLVRMSDHTSWVEGAAIWVPFGTAWSGLVDLAPIGAGEVVLISAASSSVGLAAIQLSRWFGAIPIALTRTPAKVKALIDAGAVDVIVTQEQDIVAEVMRFTNGKGASVVFDPVGGPDFVKLVDATAVGGTLVVYGALSRDITPLPVGKVLGRRLTIQGFGLSSVTRNDSKLAAMRIFVEAGLTAGALRPTIAKTFPFENIAQAHRYLEENQQIGKIVVTV